MASKTSGRLLKKPAMTIKERRALKRDKMTEASETISRRKRADRP